jgi:hypothetical protein
MGFMKNNDEHLLFKRMVERLSTPLNDEDLDPMRARLLVICEITAHFVDIVALQLKFTPPSPQPSHFYL